MPMTRSMLALALSLMMLALGPAALACEMAGPNAHVGTVTALSQKSFTLKDAESGMNLTFAASPELLKGIAVKDEVTVVFAKEGQTLRATSIKKG
jgi:hypothetical protein